MNLVMHLFKKDVRRLRVLLGLWLILVMSQAVLIGTAPGASAGDMGLQAIFYLATFLFPLLQLGALVVIIPWLVQDEPLVGTTAFWFTRPIARKDLLASKGAFMLALLVLPPLLAELIMLICNEVTPRHVALAALEVLMAQLSTVLLIWLVASMTRTFARFAVVGIIVVVVMGIVGFVATVVQIFRPFVFKGSFEVSLATSAKVVSSIFGIVFYFVAIVYQYLTRKTVRTVALVCLTWIASLIVSSGWPLDFLKKTGDSVQKEVLSGETVSIAFDSTGTHYASDTDKFRTSETPKKSFKGSLVVFGLPPGLVAYVQSIRAQAAYPDGKTLTSEVDNGFASRIEGTLERWDGDAVGHALGGIKVLNQERRSHLFETLIEVESDSFSKYGGMKGVYTADVQLNVRRYKVTGVLPLHKKARLDKGSEHVVVANVLREPHGYQVLLSVKNVTLLFASDAQFDIASFYRGGGNVLYVLRNQKRGQAFIPKEDLNAGSNVFSAHNRARLKITPLRLRYGSEFSDAVLDEAWLADADLARIEPVEVGTLSKSLRIEDFVMDDMKDRPEQGKRASAKSPAASR